MKEQSLLKKIYYEIKNIILVVFTTIFGGAIKIFTNDNKNTTIKKEENKYIKKEPPKDIIIEQPTSKDTSNIKIKTRQINFKQPSNNEEETSDSDYSEPVKKLYRVKNKKGEIKYLDSLALANLVIEEELEKIYKGINFKVKEADYFTKREIIRIKERIIEDIIINIENDYLKEEEKLRDIVKTTLIDDQIEHPLFKDITIKKEEESITLVEPHIETPPIIELPKQKETPTKEVETIIESTPIIEDIKNTTLVGATILTKTTLDLVTPSKQATPPTKEIKLEQPPIIKPTPIEEKQPEISRLKEEINEEEEKTKEELVTLKEKLEEKIKEIEKEQQEKQELPKKEEQQENKTKEKQPEKDKINIVEELKNDSDIIDITITTNALISDTTKELAKEDFEDRDYDKLERQIDKMLDDIESILIKKEGKLTSDQKERLKAQQEKLRYAKEDLIHQKDRDISIERNHLDETIKEVELNGLQNELKKLHEQNEQEVSNEFLQRMETLEGMTKEQVANMDKQMLMRRLNKASLLLEMGSIMALPFVRNKYFFHFTIGMIIDNHFNFISAFFRRKIDRYEPADLEQIKKGQDALNGALDITYKNLVELEYIKQQALLKYPELAHDYRFISQTERLREKLDRKYEKLMNKNKTMERYRIKTKRHHKILQRRKKKEQEKE